MINIIGQMNHPACPMLTQTPAEEWWNSLTVNKYGEKLLDFVVTDMWMDSEYKACFNQGLQWDKGFEEWIDALEISKDGAHGRILDGLFYNMYELRALWESIFTHRAKQAKGEK